MKIDYNSPVVLTFSLLCTVVFALSQVTMHASDVFFTLRPYFDPLSPLSYLMTVSHIFGHADAQHLFGNLSFLLLLGPILEEKYGGQALIFMIVVTAIVTSIFNILFLSTGLMGASGIVFMFIMLVSFTNFKQGKIPLTFVLIFVLFVGKEFLNTFVEDQVSQFAHIVGGICGGLFGFYSRILK